MNKSNQIKHKRITVGVIDQKGFGPQIILEVPAGFNYILNEEVITTNNVSKITNNITELSPCELQVLKLLITNNKLTTIDIAQQLNKSKNTIATYRQRIIKKLEIRNLRELNKYNIELSEYLKNY